MGGRASLLYLSLVTLSFLSMTERGKVALWIGRALVGVTLVFFQTKRFLLFFLRFEVASLPVVFLTLIIGRQVEKIAAFYYLVVYSLLFGYLFLFSFFLRGLVERYQRVVGLGEVRMKPGVGLLLSLLFLLKFPLWFLHF